MSSKNKIILIISVLHFLTVLLAILKTFGSVSLFNSEIDPVWLIIWFFALLLPIVNLAEIINNRDNWNKYYWIGLVFNILSIIFIIRHYKIDLF